ncbi:metallophosphoesterase family protein [Haliangium sp.]|uniref:metallophosphoesterase family protein n=1 Tax=Haliangium sp. TaxID=2663208 RepID=UPI003D1410BF
MAVRLGQPARVASRRPSARPRSAGAGAGAGHVSVGAERRGDALAWAACVALALTLILIEAAPARADTGRVYIPAGSEYAYRVVVAPLPTHQLGPVSLAGLARVDGASGPLPPVLGPVPADVPPPGWPEHALAGTTTGRAPFAARDGSAECECATELPDTSATRVAALYATHTFTVGDEIDAARLLLLRARYRDALVVYLNGHEVTRRNLAADAGPMAIAARPHGPEWETFYIPVRPGLLRPGENLLAIELRPSGLRLAPAFDLTLEAVAEARIVRGPIVQRVGVDAAVIAFETDLPTQAVVDYGPTPALGQRLLSAGGALAMRHLVELRDLPPGQPVHYRVSAGVGATPGYAFYPAPASAGVLRFAVYGDVRGGHDTHAALVAAILAEAPAFVLNTGDMVLRGSDEGDWQRFFGITRELMAQVPYYPVAGNHDLGRAGDESRRMNEIFVLWPAPPERPSWGHWYSFDVAGVHFVMLDSNAYQHAEQLAWLDRDLAQARARGVRAIFAATHDGPYSRGMHGGNAYAAEAYVPVLARHGVSVLFSGHDHLYQRGRADGLDYIVSGGGGAPLYRVRCGVPGRRRCREPDGMKHVTSEHHYIIVTVYPSHIEACPKRSDGSPLEPCVTFRL